MDDERAQKFCALYFAKHNEYIAKRYTKMYNGKKRKDEMKWQQKQQMYWHV
jgi:hypothetical protein